MRGAGKFFFLGVGGLVLLMIVGMLVTALFGLKPEQLASIDLISSWFWYRFGLYMILIVLWAPVCRFMVAKPEQLEDMSDEQLKTLLEKQKRDIQFLKSQWWKLLLLLVFFEIVIVQQFGL